MRDKILLECVDCEKIRYASTKNKRTTPDRLELKKFCSFCRKHVLFREVK